MTTARFNPFEDRLSRDIRNALSVSLAAVLRSQSLLPAQTVASRFLAQSPPAIYRDYIRERLNRYETALNSLPATEVNCLKTASVLWDLGLFFEVHEILEPEWIAASGDRKLLLQALIRAAGVYINLELGYRGRAAKIAGKAIPVIKRFDSHLRRDLRADRLITALENLNLEPPRLKKD